MFIVNGRIGDSPDGNFTCHTSNGQSVVDYFIVDSELLSNVTEFSVGQDNPLSDHNYLMTKIRTAKCVNIDTCSTVVTKTFYRWSEDYKMQYKETINSADIQSSFLEIVDEARAIVEPSNIDATVGKINNLIMEAAEPCKVTSRLSNKHVTCKSNVSPWYDGECENKRKLYNVLRNQYSRTQDEDDKLMRNEAKIVYVRLCKMKAKQYEKLQTTDLLNAKYSDSRSYWKMIKPVTKTTSVVHVKPEEFRSYFELLFKSIDENTTDYSGYFCEVDVLDAPFTLYEVECSIKHLKSGKAAGHDNIKSDYILMEQGNLKFVIHTLFNKLYEIGYFPMEWSTGVIVPIYKKGDKMKPENYRGITLTSTLSKMFTYLLNQRLGQWCENNNILSEAQFAYKAGYGTTDAIFVLRMLLDMNRSGIHLAFIDFSKAFDNVNRNVLYAKLISHGISSKFLKIIESMYSKINSKVRTSNGVSGTFSQQRGVMQGESLSPTLFAISINEIETLMNNIPSMGVLAGNRKLSVLKYADDLVLCSVTSDGLQHGMNALHEFCMSNNLTVNTSKSKAMYVSGKVKRKLPVIFYNQEPLDWVEDFKYLGVHIARNGKLTNGLKNVCQQARRAQATLDLHIIKHPSVSIQHIFELFDCLIKPILCYGCEIYGAENYAIIETFHLKFMKHILDVKSSTNSVMVYAETGRYPLAIYVNMCMIKFWFKILNSHIHKLIHIVYQHLLHQPCMGEWLSHVKNILCINGFGHVWINQGVDNQKQFLNAFEIRCRDIYSQQCLSEIRDSSRCRMYEEIKPSFSASYYVKFNIHKNLRICFTKLRLSSHKLLVERGRWIKPKVAYNERRCTLCNYSGIQDEFHITLCCVKFKSLREKYIQPYYYRRPSMQKFVELMNTDNRRDLHRLMIFLKLLFKLYMDTLLE